MPNEPEVTEDQIAALVAGPDQAVFRRHLGRFLAYRRRCQAAGFGSTRLVTDVHAGRAYSTVEMVEKEPE